MSFGILPSPRFSKQVGVAIDVAASLAVLAMVGMFVYGRWHPAVALQAPAAQAPIFSDRAIALGPDVKGSISSKVGMVIFSDFECPFCRQLALGVLPDLERKYVASGRLAISFRHFPNQAAHRGALFAAEIASCASQVGKFWPLHDGFFATLDPLNREVVSRRLSAIGFAQGELETCRATLGADRVNQDLKAAALLGLTGSPTTFVGALEVDGTIKTSQKLEGALPPATFEAAVEHFLKVRH